jgi:hypothetical protein
VDEVRAAYDAHGKQARAKFLSKLKMLSAKPYEEWCIGGILAKDLHGPCTGLREIRFKADDMQQRPLGFRSGEREFTLVFWAYEKGGKWVERNACEKAQERKKEVEGSKDRKHDLWLALE